MEQLDEIENLPIPELQLEVLIEMAEIMLEIRNLIKQECENEE